MPQRFDAVVVGGGVAGLVTARHLARLGESVLVIEERPTLGGFVASHEVAGVRLDAGAESYATRKGTVAALVQELGLGDDIVTPATAGAWVAWNGGTAPLPAAGVLGIPGVPLADDVRRIIGWGGSLRAYLDRLMPLLRVRPESDLGDIVGRRMGRRVLERLVTPVVAGVHSADPSVVDVRTVAPGLTQAMTTQGSLSGAVMALREQAPAGSQVQGIAGGMHRLIEALEADCRYYGVEFRTSTAVAALEQVPDAGAASAAPARYARPAPGATAPDARPVPGDGAPDAPLGSGSDHPVPGVRWRVRTRAVEPAEVASTSDAESAAAPVPRVESAAASASQAEAAAEVEARAVVVATGFRPGLALLAAAGVGRTSSGSTAALPGPKEWPTPSSVSLATLVVDDARLDAHPRGSGVLVAEGTPGVAAKALTHASAKWAWLAAELPAHRHVLRLSYGRRGADGAATAAPEVDLATALQDASTLLGVPLSTSDVVGFDVVAWNDSLAFATVGHRARVRQAIAAVERVPGLDVVGAWVSGTGLAATVEAAGTTASGVAAELRGDRRIDGL